MASKVKFPKSPTLTYNACIAGISDGLTQKDVVKQLGISKPTLKDHLAQKDTTWRILFKQFKSKLESKESKSTKVKSGKGKNTNSTSSPSQPTPNPDHADDLHSNNPDDNPHIDDLDSFEIPVQLKEMVKCSEYVCDHIEKASFGDAIKFYEKTKMLENEDKDFAEDNHFLGEVEDMLRQYNIIEEQVAALDVRVENPDAVEEGI